MPNVARPQPESTRDEQNARVAAAWKALESLQRPPDMKPSAWLRAWTVLHRLCRYSRYDVIRPTQEQLAAQLDVPRRTIQEALDDAEAHGLIKREFVTLGWKWSTVYQLTFVSELIAGYPESSVRERTAPVRPSAPESVSRAHRSGAPERTGAVHPSAPESVPNTVPYGNINTAPSGSMNTVPFGNNDDGPPSSGSAEERPRREGRGPLPRPAVPPANPPSFSASVPGHARGPRHPHTSPLATDGSPRLSKFPPESREVRWQREIDGRLRNNFPGRCPVCGLTVAKDTGTRPPKDGQPLHFQCERGPTPEALGWWTYHNGSFEGFSGRLYEDQPEWAQQMDAYERWGYEERRSPNRQPRKKIPRRPQEPS